MLIPGIQNEPVLMFFKEIPTIRSQKARGLVIVWISKDGELLADTFLECPCMLIVLDQSYRHI